MALSPSFLSSCSAVCNLAEAELEMGEGAPGRRPVLNVLRQQPQSCQATRRGEL